MFHVIGHVGMTCIQDKLASFEGEKVARDLAEHAPNTRGEDETDRGVWYDMMFVVREIESKVERVGSYPRDKWTRRDGTVWDLNFTTLKYEKVV